MTTLVARHAPKDRNKRRMQPTFVESLGSESARGVDSIPSASVGGALPMNPSYGFQGSSGVQSASMGMDRAMGRKRPTGGERSIKIPAPPQQGLSTTIHSFDGMEIDNDSADFAYTTDRDIDGDRDMGDPTSAFDSKSSSADDAVTTIFRYHTLKGLYWKQGRLGVIEREGTVRGKYAKFAAMQCSHHH